MFECKICRQPHPTQSEVEECQSQGLRPNSLCAGDSVISSFAGPGRVVKLLPASYGDHNPGVRISFDRYPQQQQVKPSDTVILYARR